MVLPSFLLASLKLTISPWKIGHPNRRGDRIPSNKHHFSVANWLWLFPGGYLKLQHQGTWNLRVAVSSQDVSNGPTPTSNPPRCGVATDAVTLASAVYRSQEAWRSFVARILWCIPMGRLVYLPIHEWLVFYGKLVGNYTDNYAIHGCYGNCHPDLVGLGGWFLFPYFPGILLAKKNMLKGLLTCFFQNKK